jgi:hypothetical protein
MAVDPLAVAATIQADLTALIDAELAQLAADAQALRGLLVEDAVVTARVLPSNGLTDLLEIAGRRVAASLPPTVRPGDVLQARVAGFDGERILLQIVGTGADAAVEPLASGAPAAPPPLPPASAAPPPLPPASAAPPLAASPAPEPAAPPAAVPLAAPAGTAVAPPGARVAPPAGTPVAVDQIPPAAPPARPGLGATFSSVVSRASVSPSPVAAANSAAAPPAPAVPSAPYRTVVVTPREPTSIEARLAATRAAVAQRVLGGGLRGFTAPPPIAPKVPPAIATQVATPSAPLAPPSSTVRVPALTAYAEPVALLRALRLPVTPSNVASATLALQRPERLPDALAALERALPRASGDPNVATLRTLLSFVGRIEPRSPALASQIAAYVDHVVDGAEPKLATLLAASRAAVPPADAPAAPAAPALAQRSAPPESPPPLPAAVAAERAAAVGADLKQTILALAADPGTPHALAPALAGALTALTAVQVGAAQTLAAQPDGLAFTIPLTTPHGVSNAHITVKRDAPEGRGGAALDPENFRIAFVLETAHYGTVAIDLVTVGREVTVDVRTEASPAMRAFRDALGGLTARLESLRYRVASAGASVGTTSTVGVEAPPSLPLDPTAAVDRSA